MMPGDSMVAILVTLPAAPAELPSLAELGRFPGARACHAQVDALTRLQQTLKQMPPSKERDDGLRHTARQLAAWELLLEAREGLGLDESPQANEEIRRAALGRLRAMLGEREWRGGGGAEGLARRGCGRCGGRGGGVFKTFSL